MRLPINGQDVRPQFTMRVNLNGKAVEFPDGNILVRSYYQNSKSKQFHHFNLAFPKSMKPIVTTFKQGLWVNVQGHIVVREKQTKLKTVPYLNEYFFVVDTVQAVDQYADKKAALEWVVMEAKTTKKQTA